MALFWGRVLQHKPKVRFFYFMGRYDRTLLERFNEKYKIKEETGCWEWQYHLNKAGYGLIKVDTKSVLSHRLSYILFIGDIEPGLFICHKCDNAKCCSPFHLFLGTNKDNINDAQSKGRLPTAVHGTHRMYAKGCRCEDCKTFKFKYDHERYLRRKNATS